MERDSKKVYEKDKNFFQAKYINLSYEVCLKISATDGVKMLYTRYIVLNITSWKQSILIEHNDSNDVSQHSVYDIE